MSESSGDAVDVDYDALATIAGALTDSAGEVQQLAGRAREFDPGAAGSAYQREGAAIADGLSRIDAWLAGWQRAVSASAQSLGGTPAAYGSADSHAADSMTALDGPR